MNIKLFNNKKPDSKSAINLYLDAGWGSKNDYIDSEDIFQTAINNSNIITAYDNDKLVGMIRFFSDHVHDTNIIEFIVEKKYQNQGIGKQLFNKLVEEFGNTSIYIQSTETSVDILKKYGFKKHHLLGMSFFNKK